MKILYVTTIGLTMGFFKTLIKEFIDDGHIVDIACNETEAKVPDCYRKWNCRVHHISCSRSMLSSGNIKAIFEINRIVSSNNYDIVHCHTPIASVCTRAACKKLRKKGIKVIYTAHGFHFYQGAPLRNWIIYYPIEKYCSKFTDILITINHEDFAFAKKKMRTKIEYVPGVGIDIDKFQNTIVDKVQKRKELGVPENAVVLVSVGELNKNKNHEVIIKVLSSINNDNIYYIIAGEGPLKQYLIDLAQKEGVLNRVRLLGYRNDIAEIYKASDIFCFPSIREGLGLAAIEAIASGLPIIASDNRGTREYIKPNVNGFSCKYDDETTFINNINTVINQGCTFEYKNKSRCTTIDSFSVKNINEQVKRIYQSLL